jgi:hypothetical protein
LLFGGSISYQAEVRQSFSLAALQNFLSHLSQTSPLSLFELLRWRVSESLLVLGVGWGWLAESCATPIAAWTAFQAENLAAQIKRAQIQDPAASQLPELSLVTLCKPSFRQSRFSPNFTVA